ncbi:MAG TPA: AtpZ/AtpI family protein [Acidimicrobiales bacterium]|nr:AtpZ/AtpI family protein [Acidimicrobiales bacterium]
MAETPPHTPDPGPPPGPGHDPTLGDFFFLGTAAAICVIAGGGIGYALDSWLNTSPWLSFAGLAFGITAAVMLVAERVRRSL